MPKQLWVIEIIYVCSCLQTIKKEFKKLDYVSNQSDLCFKEVILATAWRTESRQGARVRNRSLDQDDGSRNGFYIWRQDLTDLLMDCSECGRKQTPGFLASTTGQMMVPCIMRKIRGKGKMLMRQPCCLFLSHQEEEKKKKNRQVDPIVFVQGKL